MTHGHIQVLDDKAENPLTVYAFHTGHLFHGLEMLVQLPFSIFDRALLAHQAMELGNYGYFDRGLGFVDMFLASDPKTKKFESRYETYEQLTSAWYQLIPARTDSIGVANWIVWQRFNHWSVIPEKWAKIRPQIKVRVMNEGIVTYLIERPEPQDKKERKEWDEEVSRLKEGVIPPLQKRLTQHMSVIEVAKNLDWIIVPCDRIFIDLIWQEMGKLKSS